MNNTVFKKSTNPSIIFDKHIVLMTIFLQCSFQTKVRQPERWFSLQTKVKCKKQTVPAHRD